MKFREYVQMRNASGRGVLIDGIVRLRRFDMPDVFETWPDLRGWLWDNGGDQSDLHVAEAVYRAYSRYLKFSKLEMPCHPPTAVCGLPRGVQTVVDAPELLRLSELGHAPRKVGWQIGPSTWRWCGDLTDATEFGIYCAMRDVDGSLIQLSRFPDTRVNRYPVLFARIADGINSTKAYKTASMLVREAIQTEAAARYPKRAHSPRRNA